MTLRISSGLKMYFGFTNFEIPLQCIWSRISHFQYCYCMVCLYGICSGGNRLVWVREVSQTVCKQAVVILVSVSQWNLWHVGEELCMQCGSSHYEFACPAQMVCSVHKWLYSTDSLVSAINCILSENMILWGALCSDHVSGTWHDGSNCLLPATRGLWLRCYKCMEYVTVLHRCRLIDGWHSGRPFGRSAYSSVAFVDGLIQEEWYVTMLQVAARADMLTVVWC